MSAFKIKINLLVDHYFFKEEALIMRKLKLIITSIIFLFSTQSFGAEKVALDVTFAVFACDANGFCDGNGNRSIRKVVEFELNKAGGNEDYEYLVASFSDGIVVKEKIFLFSVKLSKTVILSDQSFGYTIGGSIRDATTNQSINFSNNLNHNEEISSMYGASASGLEYSLEGYQMKPTIIIKQP